MKKTTARKPKAATGRKLAAKNYREYLSGFSMPQISMLDQLRATIRSVVPPEASEGMSYGIPTFKYNGTLVYFGAFARHCSLFPGNSALIAKFKNELKGYITSKGAIQFPLDKPLPIPLIKKIVKARVAENKGKKGP